MPKMMQQTDTDLLSLIKNIPDGARIMVGGFGSPGTPFSLLDALLDNGTKHLTLIKNDANEHDVGIAKLISANRVDALITSHLGLNRDAIARMNEGKLKVEFVPQGVLAERIRCKGVGLQGFFSDVGVDTEISDEHPLIEVEGKLCRIELPIQADFALIHAARGDIYGNLMYSATAANFNPLMAMAADTTIAEVMHLTEEACPPNQIHTPGVFIDHCIEVPAERTSYQLMEHHTHE